VPGTGSRKLGSDSSSYRLFFLHTALWIDSRDRSGTPSLLFNGYRRENTWKQRGWGEKRTATVNRVSRTLICGAYIAYIASLFKDYMAWHSVLTFAIFNISPIINLHQEQDRQCTYNVALRSVHETVVATEKQ
jgi:hypothetical protein